MLVHEKRSKMKVRVPKGARLTRFLLSPAGKTLLASVAIVTVAERRHFHLFLPRVFPHHRSKIAAGAVCQYFKDFCRVRAR